MNTKQLASIGALAAIMTLTPLSADAGRIGVRVQAKVRTPVGTVRVHTPPRPVRVVRHAPPRPVRVMVRHDVTRHDRTVARRLADYTGVSKREILRVRRLGYRWSEIGLWLELPRRTVRAALSADTWGAFMRRELRLDHDRGPRHGQIRVHCEHDDRYDDDRDGRW